MSTTESVTVRGRPGGDLVLGALEVLVGLVILANAATATKLSLVFVGWLLFATGVVALAWSLLRRDSSWSAVLGGGLMAVLGVVFLRHTEAAAVTVTLVAGALWAATGVARLSAAFSTPEQRLPLLLSGLVSLALGLIVLLNLLDASYRLLGILLGLQVVAEGLAVMLFGRGGRRARLVDDDLGGPG